MFHRSLHTRHPVIRRSRHHRNRLLVRLRKAVHLASRQRRVCPVYQANRQHRACLASRRCRRPKVLSLPFRLCRHCLRSLLHRNPLFHSRPSRRYPSLHSPHPRNRHLHSRHRPVNRRHRQRYPRYPEHLQNLPPSFRLRGRHLVTLPSL
jgi:hypothetical protein